MFAFFVTSGLGADVRMVARSPAAASPSFFTACVVAMPKSPKPTEEIPQDLIFSQWRYLSGFTARSAESGPCRTPQWSTKQEDAIFLWDDSPGLVGELSIAFIPQLRLWIALYADVTARTASYPWGPWSDPITLFDRNRHHAQLSDPTDPRPRYINADGDTYGAYIVPRFTECEPVTGIATL